MHKKPITQDTLFRMASTTKPVTAVAILMLMEEGKLRLTDPVSRFIPEFKETKVAVAKPGSDEIELVAANRAITIRDLLTHTSGLGSGGAGSKEAAKVNKERKPTDTLADAVPRLGTVPLDFQPGTKWTYSGGAGFDVLARIVEVASGQSFDRFLQQRLFDPLGMKDTFFVVPDDRKARLATISAPRGRGWKRCLRQASSPARLISPEPVVSLPARRISRVSLKCLLTAASSTVSACLVRAR
jgi:CubicO group peptidase (beta-lactamase class C family)